MIDKINNILNNTIIRVYQFLRFYTVWSILIGVLFFYAPPFMRAAAIVNILCCSIFGIIIVSKHVNDFSKHYSFTVGEIRIHDIVLHVLLPVAVIGKLLENMKPYNFFAALFFSVIIGVFYLFSMNFNNIYAYIPNICSYILSLWIVLIFFHIVIYKYFKKSSS